MSDIAVYGGSFDPITTAHADIIKKLAERFDEVRVVPCRLSPFKTSVSASAEDRLAMLDMALAGIPRVTVDTGELYADGTNYTYLTLERLSGPGRRLRLVMGSEMVIELEKWKRVDRMCELAELYVIPRPGFPLTGELTAKLDALFPARWTLADFQGMVGSSSEVRISFAMGEPEMFMAADTAAYAAAHGLYGEYSYVNGLYAEYKLKPKRIRHSFSTALCGVELAKRCCADTRKATVALLLHDIGKYITKEDAESMGIVFGPAIDDMPLPVRHAEIGAEILRQKLHIDDDEIVEAVRWHTTGKPAMTVLEKVVYLADCIEPLRDYPGVDVIRRETEKGIDEGLLAALRMSVEHVGEEGLYPLTREAYLYYKNESERQGA